ncbi:MAG TPA: hypothetical protein VN083_07110, partial [Vicinamibacteria bacterium]|nr:hypothetical protein [Vicinamibacteria bacterium]
MELTSIDVIASALEGEAPAQLGEMSSPDGALTLLFCDVEEIAAIRATLDPEQIAGMLRDQGTLVRRIAEHHGGGVVRSHDD